MHIDFTEQDLSFRTDSQAHSTRPESCYHGIGLCPRCITDILHPALNRSVFGTMRTAATLMFI